METNILMTVYDLIDEIKSLDIYIEYKELEKNLDSNLIEQYNIDKKKYENLRGGKYHPDYEKYSKLYINSKIKLMSDENIKRYLEIEKEIGYSLNKLSASIASVISDEIRTPNEIGLLRGCIKK